MQSNPSIVVFGSKTDLTVLKCDLRYAPECGHPGARAACPFRAVNGPRGNPRGTFGKQTILSEGRLMLTKCIALLDGAGG
jgi:hypothetical protein